MYHLIKEILELPCELLFIIFNYLNTSDLRKLRKIPELAYYHKELQKRINKENQAVINFYSTLLNTYLHDGIIDHIEDNNNTIQIPERIPDQYLRSLNIQNDFNYDLIKKIEINEYQLPIEKCIVIYDEVQKQLNNELPCHLIFTNKITNVILNKDIQFNLQILSYAKLISPI